MAQTPTTKQIKSCIIEVIVSCGMTLNDLLSYVANRLGFKNEVVFEARFQQAIAELENEEKIKKEGELYLPGPKLETPPQPAGPLDKAIKILEEHRNRINRTIRELKKLRQHRR